CRSASCPSFRPPAGSADSSPNRGVCHVADRSVRVVLRAEIGQYKQAMAEASRATKGVSDEGVKASKAGREFVDSWAKAGQPLLAVGGAMTSMSVAVIKTGVAYNQLQQQSRAALTT